jgi:hypothetical protein
MRYRDVDETTYQLLRDRAGEVRFHAEPQDTECAAWERMLELVERAAKDERSVFWPASELEPEDLVHIIELPPSIAKLKSVTHLRLYGSHLVRIPPAIGEMSSLENLDVLHVSPSALVPLRENEVQKAPRQSGQHEVALWRLQVQIALPTTCARRDCPNRYMGSVQRVRPSAGRGQHPSSMDLAMDRHRSATAARASMLA